MKTLGKILGIVVFGLLLIAVAAGFALTHLLDPNDYKDEIRQLARDKANLELNIEGEIGWSLFPWLGLELTDTTLASAGTPEQPFAGLRQLGFSVRVLPLLRKEIQMSDIRVDGLNLTLQRDAKGQGNWEGIGATEPAGQPEAQVDQPDALALADHQPDAGSRAIQLDIDSLTVSNARLDYSDALSGQQMTLENIELSTGKIREGSDIPLKLSAFFGINQPVVRARSELQGTLRFEQALQRYQLNDLKLRGEVSGEPLQGKTLDFSAQGQLLVDLAAGIAEWNGLKLSANQLRAMGEIKVHDLSGQAKIAGGLSIASLNLREFLNGIGVELPDMADRDALTRFELNSRLAGSFDKLMLEQVDLKLDDTVFTGQFGIADLDKLALRVTLSGDKLDADRYLPPADQNAAAAARKNEVKSSIAKSGNAGTTPLPDAPTQQAWSNEKLLPVETLRQLDFQLALSLEQMKLSGQPFTDISLKAQGRNGVLDLSGLNARLLGGSIAAKVAVDVRQREPQLKFSGQLAKIPLEPLLKDGDQPAPLKGQLNLKADLNAKGNSQKDWIDGLNGTADFNIADGMLVGTDLEQHLCQAIAVLNRKTLSNPPKTGNTAFKALDGSLTIRNGVAHNPDMRVQIPGLSVTGKGDLDLRVLGLDYLIGIIIEGDRREMPDPACQVNLRYIGIEWPLRCRGPLELGAKACRVDQDGLGKIAAKVAGSKLSEKLEEKVGDKVSPDLKDALKGLFNR